MPTRTALTRVWPAASLLLALFSGCGSGASSTSISPPAATATVTVSIKGYAFVPPTARVVVGAYVTWVNHDATAHTATADGQQFDTGSIAPGARHAISFSKPGTYLYHCAFHAFMQARITVTK